MSKPEQSTPAYWTAQERAKIKRMGDRAPKLHAYGDTFILWSSPEAKQARKGLRYKIEKMDERAANTPGGAKKPGKASGGQKGKR